MDKRQVVTKKPAGRTLVLGTGAIPLKDPGVFQEPPPPGLSCTPDDFKKIILTAEEEAALQEARLKDEKDWGTTHVEAARAEIVATANRRFMAA